MTYYDYVAEGYDELHKEEQLRKLKVIVDNLEIGPSDRVLDVGCGPGFAAELMDANITGIDPSEELLKRCPFKAVKGRAEELPFPDNAFDVVISVTAIHNFEFIGKGLQEMKRVGKHRFVFSVLKKAKRFYDINTHIRRIFKVIKTIDEGTDLIYFCE